MRDVQRQLNLFRSRRQRGEHIPAPKEFALHVALADLVRRWIMPQWRFTHLPMGELRDDATALKLKRMGVMPGWPDFIFVGPQRQLVFIELKRPGSGRLSDAQIDVFRHLATCGCTVLCTDDLNDAIETLRSLGIVRARVSA